MWRLRFKLQIGLQGRKPGRTRRNRLGFAAGASIDFSIWFDGDVMNRQDYPSYLQPIAGCMLFLGYAVLLPTNNYDWG